MQKWHMANNIFQCDFLLQPLLDRLHLMILAFLSRELLYGKNFNRSSRKDPSQDFFVFSCFRYPRYQRIIGHMPNTRNIFCLQLRLYGPVTYFSLAWPNKCKFGINLLFSFFFNYQDLGQKLMVKNQCVQRMA